MRLDQRILVVDDDDAIRALVLTVLRRRGHLVDVARNGAEALEKMSVTRYTLVVLDLMMPRVSGYEVMDHLSRESIMTRPRVLVLTAGNEPRTLDTALVVGTMHKPFDVQMLLDIVAGCLAATDDPQLAGPAPEAVETTRPN